MDLIDHKWCQFEAIKRNPEVLYFLRDLTQHSETPVEMIRVVFHASAEKLQ